jgi:alanine racemase
MDMLTVDLTHLPQAGIGSTVTLWGDAPRIEALAPLCGVSAYQLPCGVKRVVREYVGG